MKNIIFIFSFLFLFLVSCNKDSSTITENSIKSTKNLTAQSKFDWKTSKEITLTIIGMTNINPNITNVLLVKSSNGDTVYYKDILVMLNDYTLKFSVPTIETKVILIYGSKTATIDLLSNTITYNYQ